MILSNSTGIPVSQYGHLAVVGPIHFTILSFSGAPQFSHLVGILGSTITVPDAP